MIMCFLGFHRWTYFQPKNEAYPHDPNYLTGLKVSARRGCEKCGKVEEQTVHCLGINPPKHIWEWKHIGWAIRKRVPRGTP